MHGHALSGTRKLNRHWQSGGGFELEENLVFFEREKDITEWRNEPGDDEPYWIHYKTGMSLNLGKWLQLPYEKKNPERSLNGFKQLVITRPGDYKVHWELETHKVESFNRDGDDWQRIVEGDYNQNFGMFGVNMMPPVDYYVLSPDAVERYLTTNGVRYYTGGCDSYIAWHPQGNWGYERLYENTDLPSILVSPSRSSTRTLHWWNNNYDGAYTFNLNSGNETPEIILHIGSKAPFPEYDFTPYGDEAHFEITGYYYAPLIDFLFVDNMSGSAAQCAVTGKIWLERIGDYTDLYEGWEPKIL